MSWQVTYPLIIPSALFANVVSLNSTTSNTSVPFGLWALPELPQITNLSLPNIGGRKKRDVDEVSLYELNNSVDVVDDDGALNIPEVLKLLTAGSQEDIFHGFNQAATLLALMNNNKECQAAIGCRYVLGCYITETGIT